MNRFSGQDEPLFDFPVANRNDFPVRKRFSGQFLGDLLLGLLYLLLGAAIVFMAGMVLFLLGVGAYSLWLLFQTYPLWTALGTGGTLVAYAGATALARKHRREHERQQ